MAEGLGKVSNKHILPKLSPGKCWGITAHKVSGVGHDEEDEANAAINSLNSCIMEIHNALLHPVDMPAMGTQSASNIDDLACLRDFALTSSPIPYKSTMPVTNLTHKEAP